jgi:hypothetical protein
LAAAALEGLDAVAVAALAACWLAIIRICRLAL